jgi:putative membrane protein
MANERTFLAWVRTSLGIMALGFVVEKFGLLLRDFPALAGGRGLPASPQIQPMFSTFIGAGLVGLGATLGVLAFVKYKKVEREIEANAYRPSMLLDVMLTLVVVVVGVFLVVYLLHNA